MYSTGETAAGATVTLSKTVSGSTTHMTTSAGGDGSYAFQTESGCADYQVQAASSEIVDNEPLPPSGTRSSSGCFNSNLGFSDLVINKPHPIVIGGHVKIVGGRPIQGAAVTMTRTKYDLSPPNVVITTTTTDSEGHYQFNTFSRCSVAEELSSSIAGVPLPGTNTTNAVSGCVLQDYPDLDMTAVFPQLLGAGRNPLCNEEIPRPVTVTNGNMYLQQVDFRLPGAGEATDVTRTYNSVSQNIGLFGRGWTSTYDETVTEVAGGGLELTLPDGRLVNFLTPDFYGQTVKNGNGTFTVTFKDGYIHQFNTAGKLVSLTDRNGNQTLLTYAGGKLSSVIDPFSRVLTITTNTPGQVTSISDSVGTIASYAYGGNNELASVTYADNSAFQFSYVSVPGGLALVTVTDALGNTVEHHEYDSQGRAITSETHNGVEAYTLNYVSATETDVTDALGHVTKYFFHQIKGDATVTRVEGVCGCGGGSQVQTWTYDNQRNVTSIRDSLSHTVSHTYDNNGNQLTRTDGTGMVTYTYNQFGEVLTRTDQMNGVTTNTYDVNGNLLTINDALNNTATITYDTRGQALTFKDARNKVTSFAWDTSGRLTQRTDALQNVASFAYDARARLTGITNSLNQAANYEYDLAGRLKKTIFPDNNFVQFTYDLAGRRTKVKDPRGNETNFAYDGAYRLTSQTDAASHTTGYGYDLMSNLTSLTDALGRVTNYEYDEFNRVKKIIYPPAVAGATRLQEIVEYDAAGRITKKTDTAGRDTIYAYDTINRLTTVTDPASQATQFEYNARSQTTAVIDALNQHYTLSYDALGQVTGTTRADVSMNYVYDAVGNRTQRTDYNGSVTNYTYDDLNRLTTISYPDTTMASYAYDALSRLTSAANQNGTVTLAYDNRGRLISTTDVFDKTIGYSYDANCNRTAMTLEGASYATYEYDTVNRLISLTDSASHVVNYSFDSTNKLTSRILPNGVESTYTYDDLDRLTRLRDLKGANTILDNQYSYNTANQISQIQEPSLTHIYGYDALDRLSSASGSTPAEYQYQYDTVGNRTDSPGRNYLYNPVNRLVAIAPSNTLSTEWADFTYNNNGTLTSKTDGTGNTTYSWDADNRLIQVHSIQASTDNGGGDDLPDLEYTVTYKYDALGRRIQRVATVSGPRPRFSSTNFVFENRDVIEDINDDGTVITKYVNGPGVDNKLSQTNAVNGTLYFSLDHLGSTRALTDASGNVVENRSYDSFGNSSGSSFTNYGYTGRELDADTGLMYYRARWYDPQVGRFISEDPIGFAAGANFYTYVDNNPTRFTDPSGLCPQKSAGQRCDERLAGIFGGPGAVVGSARDPLTVGRNPQILALSQKYGWSTDRIGERLIGHGPAPYANPDPKSSDRGGIIHIYGNDNGTATGTGLYTPAGGSIGSMITRHAGTPAAYTQINVNYNRGPYAGLTIAYVHVSAGSGQPNATGSVRIGNIGGLGSIDSPNYIHTHAVFYMNGARVDPRTIFCKEFGF